MERISPQMLGLAQGDVTLFTGQTPLEGGAPRRLPLRRLVKTALRWRWLLLGGVAAGAVLGAGLTLVMQRQYTAISRLQISRETARVVEIDAVQRDTSIGDQEFYQTEYGLLRSQVLAERVARDLGVVDDPAFFKLFGRRAAFDKYQAPTPENEAKRDEIAGNILMARVGISPVRGSSLVDVRAVTPDPVLSQKIALTWGQDFIASNLERRFEASSYARRFLEGRLEELREKLEVSEKQAVAYAAEQGIINLPSPSNQNASAASDNRSLVTDDLGALNAVLETATAERIEAQSRLQEMQRPDASSLALGNEAIAGLRQKRAETAGDYAKLMVQFRPDYPQAKALESQLQTFDDAIAKEEGRVRTSLQQAYQSAVTRERALLARVDMLKQNLLDFRRRNIQYNIYQRDVDTNRELYNALLQRYKEIGIAGEVENNNISIVDPPKIPDRPSSPRLPVNILLGIFICGLIAAGAAATLEQMDDGITDPADIEEKLGVPQLGVAPKVKTAEPLIALQDQRSNLVEAYLAVQANLELSTARGMPKSLAVVSTRAREGKSTTTIALARSLARAHRKVVIVDADMRRPSVHSAFGAANTYGLSHLLAGGDDLDQALSPTDQEGLWILTAGPQPPNAADLLMGERLSRLIEQLLTRFDHVIVDCPPVLGLADAPLVAAAVEGVVYAVEARAVPVGAVTNALNRLRAARAHILGAVLTKYEAKRSMGAYGHDDGYGYGYGH